MRTFIETGQLKDVGCFLFLSKKKKNNNKNKQPTTANSGHEIVTK